MKRRLGITLEQSALRAVLVEHRRVTWAHSVPAAPNGTDWLLSAANALWRAAPPQAKHAHTEIGLSPSWVQVKPLAGVPPVKPLRVATELVRENARSFFLARSSALAVAELSLRPDGSCWGAAFDRDIVEELARAVREAGHKVTRVIPVVAALAARAPLASVDGANPEIPRDGDTYFAAYCVAVVPRRLPLCWLLPRDDAQLRVLTVARRTAACFAIGMAAAFAALGPGIHAMIVARDANAELSRSLDVQRELSRLHRDLSQTTATLNRLSGFNASRGRMTRTLAAVSQSTPESTAIIAFHLDSADGGFTMIAPRVADVLPELNGIDGIIGPRIVGAVTRETQGGVHVERAAVRFSRVAHSSAKTRVAASRP
jgi:hypothetical protein